MDDLCDCSSPPNLTCQMCEGENGRCNGTSDNGLAVFCADDQDTCLYHYIGKCQHVNLYTFKTY